MEKAYLMVYSEDKNKGPLQKTLSSAIQLPMDNKLTLLFNPKEFTVSRTNSWGTGPKAGSAAGQNAPSVEFTGGNPADLSLELLFDTYHNQSGEKCKSVYTEYVQRLELFVDVSDKFQEKGDSKATKKGRPPRVTFVWGQFDFDGVITSMRVQYTLFSNEGTPVRANVSLQLQQVEDPKAQKAQNPTSGGDGGERHCRINRGDTLQAIAFEELGDANRWREIAGLNGLHQVRDLEAGRMLMLPRN
jgi:hypothetical protein